LKIIFFPKVKTKEFQTKKLNKKGRHKDKTPTDDLLREKVTAVILGILTLLNISVLGVGLKFRSKELELEADIW